MNLTIHRLPNGHLTVDGRKKHVCKGPGELWVAVQAEVRSAPAALPGKPGKPGEPGEPRRPRPKAAQPPPNRDGDLGVAACEVLLGELGPVGKRVAPKVGRSVAGFLRRISR